MKYIYLDWNVIQYMKHAVKKDHIDGEEFYRLFEKISKKYCFPFSRSHLIDLASSPENIQTNYIDNDLNYLKKISKNHAITINPIDNKFIIINSVDIHKEFEGVKKSVKQENNMNFEITLTGECHEVDMEKLSKKDLFRDVLEQNNGVLTPTVMTDFIKNASQKISNPSFYKEFRKQISEIKSKFRKTQNTIIDKKSAYFKGLIPFFDFMLEQDEDKLLGNFNNAVGSYLSIDGRSLNDLDKFQKIQVAYMLLDFNPKFYDNVSISNKPANIFNDIEHLFFASEGKYYVTEDDSTFKKSSFVAKFLFPSLTVLKMNELQHRFA